MAGECTKEESSIRASDYYTHFRKVRGYVFISSGRLCKIS